MCSGFFGLSGRMIFFSGGIGKFVFVLVHGFVFCHPIFSLARLLLVFLLLGFDYDSLISISLLQTCE